jgi:uncharacterized protein YukE
MSSYDTISVNITAVEEALGKMRQARLDVQTEKERLQKITETTGEGKTADNHRANEQLTEAAVYEAAAMDSLIQLVGNTLEAYTGTDQQLAQRITAALYGQ